MPITVADRLLGLRVRIPPGAWMSVVSAEGETKSVNKASKTSEF